MALWQVGTKLPQLNHLSRTWGWRCCLSLPLSLLFSLSVSVHLWRNLLASCNKPLHMRRLAGYTYTHTRLGTCNRRRQRPVTVSGSMRLPQKICGSFFVFLINKIIKAIIKTTTRETNFVCCVGKLRCHPVADTIQDQFGSYPLITPTPQIDPARVADFA